MAVTGAAGMVFVVTVVLQNAVFGTSAPLHTASASEIVAFFRRDDWLVSALYGTLPLADLALLAWAAGMYARLREDVPVWLMTGLLGVAGIVAMFTASTAIQLAMAARVDLIEGDPVLVEMLWALHNGAFTTAIFFIGAAQLGLGVAAALAGLLPRWYRWVAGAGGLLMMAATVPAIQLTDRALTLPVALPGFGLWLVLVAWSGWRLLLGRTPYQSPTSPG